MSSGLNADNPTVVSAFHTTLVHQGLVALILLALVLLVWNLLRAAQLRAAAEGAPRPVGGELPEPAARKLLRVVFGCFWVLDGLLQAQPAMPLGMMSEVVKPAAAGSPAWVRDLVNAGGTIWNYHPVEAAAAAVFIQLGLGLWLLVAPRGTWSRLGGAGALCWGLIVWSFGESFGGIFAPGQSWLFGAPGGVVFYCAAGLLIALPERYYEGPRLGRVVLGLLGTFFVGMSLVQAWPGNDFWHGGPNGTLVSMESSMAQTPQPGLFSSLVRDFGAFSSAHAFAVNLFVVAALALIGLAFLSGNASFVRPAVVAAAVLCVADWVLVQDFGFFGGVGTDPNSMLPMLALIGGGYVALTRPAAVSSAEAVAPRTPVEVGGASGAPGPAGAVARLRRQATERPGFVLRSAAAIATLGIVLIGAVPMALASVNPHADPIVSEAVDGTPDAVNYPAPAFTLEDQYGRLVSLKGLRRKAVVMTFLDPVCTSDCPLIAQELRQLDSELGSAARKVEIVAVVTNPLYHSVAAVDAFDRAEGLNKLSNWFYLTGSPAQLRKVWNAYGIQVAVEAAGSMIAHSDLVYVLDGRGHTRYALDADPGPGSQASTASFTAVLQRSVETVLARP